MAHSDTDLSEQLTERGLTDWSGSSDGIHARFRTGNFRRGLDLVAAIGETAEQQNHHPDLTLTYPQVDVRLISHDVGGVTDRDLSMAARISEIAAEHGVDADRSGGES